MTDPTAAFIRQAPPIDSVREEAARCCDETARYERRERGPLRNPIDDGLLAEFSDAAFGVASEVAMAVGEACKSVRVGWRPDFPWSTAAKLLRAGWQRGNRLQPHVIGRGPKQ